MQCTALPFFFRQDAADKRSLRLAQLFAAPAPAGAWPLHLVNSREGMSPLHFVQRLTAINYRIVLRDCADHSLPSQHRPFYRSVSHILCLAAVSPDRHKKGRLLRFEIVALWVRYSVYGVLSVL